jgi:hypothetical protein
LDSDVWLLAIKDLDLLPPGRNPGRFALLLAVVIAQPGFHVFGSSEDFEKVGLNLSKPAKPVATDFINQLHPIAAASSHRPIV